MILGFIDKPPYIVFNIITFGIVLVGLVLIHASYRYVSENHMPAGRKTPIYPLALPAFLVIQLICAAIYLNYSATPAVVKEESLSNVEETQSNDEELSETVPPLDQSKVKKATDIDYFVPLETDKGIAQQLTSLIHQGILKITKPSVDDFEDMQTAQEYGVKFSALIAKNDWAGLESLVQDYSKSWPEALNVGANLMLMYGAPIEQLEKYLSMGAQVAPAATLSLVAQGRVTELEKLENFGINYSSELPLQMSMLDMALLSPLPMESFNFLLDRTEDISKFKPEMKLDTLAITLLAAEVNQELSPVFVDAIMKKDGVKITEQHRKIIDVLQKTSPKLANDLLSKISNSNS